MAILFDLDGTLLDTSRDFHVAINKVLAIQQKPSADYATIRDAISFGSKRIVADAFKRPNLSDAEVAAYVDELLPVFLEHYAATGFKNTFAFPGIDDLLASLERSNISWGIVTNKHKILTEPLLQKTGYFDRSACVVCGDTTPNPKPAPDPLLYACDLLQVDPKDCVFIGDAQTDIEAGKAAGMRTIAAAFGFVPNNVNIADWQADAIVASAQDILPVINKWLPNG